MHEYVVVNVFDKKPKSQYWLNDLPTHLTLSNTLLADIAPHEFLEIVKPLANTYQSFTVIAKSREMFGERQDIDVTEIAKSDLIEELHLALLEVFGDKARLKNPEFGGKNYRPHVTDQPAGRANIGDVLIVDNLAFVEIRKVDIIIHGTYKLI